MKALVRYLIFLFPVLTTAQSNLSDPEVSQIIERHRPSRSGVPEDIKGRLGATHMNGQYYLTDEPFIIEGARKVNELGYGVLKLWFYKDNGNQRGYKYNSDWGLTRSMTLEELARHPYYREVFDMDFSVFTLNIKEGLHPASIEEQQARLKQVQAEFYSLTKYLLETYQDREITFILSNWEGDWAMRGGTSKVSGWSKENIPDDAPIRVANMISWVKARQAGVDQARRDSPTSKCKVYNAIEVNKVFDGVIDGMPTITTDVLPQVKVDMVSWSAYDGKSPDGVKMYRGIEYIRQHMNPTDYMKGEKVVFIGEINQHENVDGRTKESVTEFCDLIMGVYLAQNIPYVIYWELYSNDTKEGPKDQSRVLSAEELRGNWLIRPDGSHGWAQQYFDTLLAQAGQKSPIQLESKK